MNRNLINILLFVCLILPISIVFIFLQYQKKELKKSIKHQINQGISIEELVLIKLSKKDIHTKLNWETFDEFEYQGALYDVVKTKSTSDSVYYYCWLDNEELVLNKQLAMLLNVALNNNTDTNKLKTDIAGFCNKLFCNNVQMYHKVYFEKLIIVVQQNYNIVNPFYKVPENPPQIS